MPEKFPTSDSLKDATSDVSTGQRVVSLANTQRYMPGGNIYIAPDQKVMQQIEEETAGKVVYFPAHQPTQGNLSNEPLFSVATMRPLVQELTDKYPDRNLALRAIMASVNGTMKDAMGPGGDILDITDITARGTEKDHDVFNVQAMPKNPDDPLLYGIKHVAAYAFKVPYALRFYSDPQPDTPPNFEESVFPAIMVYDADALQSTPHDRFTATFREGVNPPAALLSAYVLDKPGMAV